MAIDRTGISSLDAGASDITYSGNEGPRSPQEEQQMQMAQLEQEYEQYRMEQMEIDPSKVLSFEEWFRMTYEASRQGVADGGIMRLGYANGQLVQPGPGRPGYQGGVPPSVRGKDARDYGPYSKGPSPRRDPDPAYQAPHSPHFKEEEETRQFAIQEDIRRRALEKDYTPEGVLKDKTDETETEKGDGILDTISKYGYDKSMLIPGAKKRAWKKAKDYRNYLNTQGVDVSHLGYLDDMDYKDWSFEDYQSILGMEPTRREMPPPELIGKHYFPMDFANWNLVSEKNPGLFMSGDLSHFYQTTKPKGAINPETGLPFTTSEWNKFRDDIVMSRGLHTPGKGHPDPEVSDPCKGPNPPAWCTAEPTLPVVPPVVPPPVNPVTGNPQLSEYHIPGASNFYSNLASSLPEGQTRGVTFDQPSEMLAYHYPPEVTPPQLLAANGGRAGYAGGGITDLRQGYFLGDLVKGILKPFKGLARGVKKFSKSKAGKLAIMAALGYFGGGGGIGSFKGWGGAGFGGSPLAKMVTGGGGSLKDIWSGKLGKAPVPGERMGGLWNWIKKNPFPAIAGASAAGGLYTALAGKDDMPEWLKKWYADKQRRMNSLQV